MGSYRTGTWSDYCASNASLHSRAQNKVRAQEKGAEWICEGINGWVSELLWNHNELLCKSTLHGVTHWILTTALGGGSYCWPQLQIRGPQHRARGNLSKITWARPTPRCCLEALDPGTEGHTPKIGARGPVQRLVRASPCSSTESAGFKSTHSYIIAVLCRPSIYRSSFTILLSSVLAEARESSAGKVGCAG